MLNELTNKLNQPGVFNFLTTHEDGIVVNGFRVRLGIETIYDVSVFVDDVESDTMIELLGAYELVTKKFHTSILLEERVANGDDIEWLYDLLDMVRV